MFFSFIIPTLNEESFIRAVLAQFDKLREDWVYEIIVSDNDSQDRTVSIAREMGAAVVENKGICLTIGENRNAGAALARGDVLVFCDADTLFQDVNSLVAHLSDVFQNNKVVAVMPEIAVFPAEAQLTDRLFHGIRNRIIALSFKTLVPYASGQCQAVRREAFEQVGGYSSRIHAEDTALFRQLRSLGKLVYLKGQVIYESPRRYRHYGYFKYIMISLLSLFSQDLFKKNIFKEWKRVG